MTLQLFKIPNNLWLVLLDKNLKNLKKVPLSKLKIEHVFRAISSFVIAEKIELKNCKFT